MGLLNDLFGGDASTPTTGPAPSGLAYGGPTLTDRLSGPMAQVGLQMMAASGGPRTGYAQSVATGLANSAKIQKEQQQRNQTMEVLQRDYPDIAQAIGSGALDVADGFTLMFKRQSDAKEDAYRKATLSLQRDKFAYDKTHDADTLKSWQKLDDSTLYNPITGETQSLNGSSGGRTFSGNSVEAQSLNGLIESGALTREQALQMGAGKTVSGPNGEVLFMTPQGVFRKDGAGAGAPADRSGMIPLTDPKVTGDERKAQTFADRMTTSGQIIDEMGDKGNGLYDRAASNLPFGLDGYVTSEDFQKIDQAKRDFINAQLRRESGAVIGADEFANANKQYFPQPGESEEVRRQKRANRQLVIDGMVRDGGPTYSPPKGGTTDYHTRYGLE